MPFDDVNDSPSLQPIDGLTLPWTINPASSWLDYNCWVQVELDAGMVLHKSLPQAESDVDTLASVLMADYAFAGNPDAAPPATGGVNINPDVLVQDTIQRMATSTYRFVLMGYGLRAGFQIPIPGLSSVGGIAAVPEGKQRAYNKVVGNWSGVPIWAAEWELHYIVAGLKPVATNAPVPPNMAARINAATKPPNGILVPFAPVDNGAVQPTLGFFQKKP